MWARKVQVVGFWRIPFLHRFILCILLALFAISCGDDDTQGASSTTTTSSTNQTTDQTTAQVVQFMDDCTWDVHEKPCAEGSQFRCLPSPKDPKEEVGWNLSCTIECETDADCGNLGRCIRSGPGNVITCVPDSHWAATYFKTPFEDGSCNDGQESGCAGKCNYTCPDGLTSSCPYQTECFDSDVCGLGTYEVHYCVTIAPWDLGDGPPSLAE